MTLELVLAHFASQLLHKWMAFPYGDITQKNHRWQQISIAEWKEVSHLSLRKNSTHWADRYRSKIDSLGTQLATKLHAHIQKLYDVGGALVCIDDEEYPPLLRMIEDPPLCLSVIGETNRLTQAHISVVGARRASVFALNQSYALGEMLAARNYCVVSGGAYGCDIAAHCGVVDSQPERCPAAIVQASGLGFLYPNRHLSIFKRIIKNGGIILSERLWDQIPQKIDFLNRNRIISGFSAQTIVMQAGKRSGAMGTAAKALSQGRDVFVLLHPAGDIRALGNHQLFMDGALGFKCAKDFTEGKFFTCENKLKTESAQRSTWASVDL